MDNCICGHPKDDHTVSYEGKENYCIDCDCNEFDSLIEFVKETREQLNALKSLRPYPRNGIG